MTLIVVADQHIGAGASLGDRLADQRSSWTRVCTTASEIGADVLHAGDVFHARRPLPVEMRAFQAGLDILREGGRTLLIAAGNHDVADRATPTAAEAACAGYDAHVYREPAVVETEDGVVGFLPWTPGTGDARRTAEALMVMAEHLADQGARILVAHWALAGGSLPNGLPLLDLAEPMLDPFALAGMFDVTLCGHIHKRQVIVEEPLVAHIGPLSRTNFGEALVKTGAWQIDATLPVAARPLIATWFEVPDRRMSQSILDLRGVPDPTAAVIESIGFSINIADEIHRMSWHQTADQVIDAGAIRAALVAAGAHYVDSLTPIIERPQSIRSAGISEQTGPHESWDAYFEPQVEALGELAGRVNEQAHERIGGAAA